MGWRRRCIGICVGLLALLAACSRAKAPAKPAPPTSQPPAPAAPQQAEKARLQPSAPPPQLELQALQEHLALGLAIQNHSDALQRFASTVTLVGEGQRIALRLAETQDCLVLGRGAEWLWPDDWQRSLAPDQRALAGLSGEYHFELRGCEGGPALRSESFRLPLRYR